MRSRCHGHRNQYCTMSRRFSVRYKIERSWFGSSSRRAGGETSRTVDGEERTQVLFIQMEFS